MNENNLAARRAAFDAYLRYCHMIYQANAADYAAAREILAERRELHPDGDDAVINLEAELSIWATENASIRAGLMNAFAERAMRAAQDYKTEVVDPEIARIFDLDDTELRGKIAEQVEKIKYERRMRGNHHDEEGVY